MNLPDEITAALANPRLYPRPWVIRYPTADVQHAHYIFAVDGGVYRAIYGSDNLQHLSEVLAASGMSDTESQP
jgi:hypothetical protein